MTKQLPPETRQFGWIDFEIRAPPTDRAIMVRDRITTSLKAKYAGNWFLPRIVIAGHPKVWMLSPTGGKGWVVFTIDIDPLLFQWQWRDIPGTPMRQAIQMAKLATES